MLYISFVFLKADFHFSQELPHNNYPHVNNIDLQLISIRYKSW